MDSSQPVEIRRAVLSDASALARLRYEFRAPRAPTIESEQDFVERCTGWTRARLADSSSWMVWVVVASDAIVGNVWMQHVEKLPNPGEEPEWNAYVSSFYIRETFRGRGIGSQLMQLVLDEASRLGVGAVFLWPTERSRPLYERFGFTHDGAVLSLERR
jgi:GNAT superfamily N-acetyltransferase